MTDKLEFEEIIRTIRLSAFAGPASPGFHSPTALELVILHYFPEHEHLIINAPVVFLFFRDGWTLLKFVPEFNNVETAAVNVKMDVSLLEVRGYGFPDFDF